ncbi:MAG: CHASE2 domain-containing protein, partial [Cyanobacteria bacterium J06638_6]
EAGQDHLTQLQGALLRFLLGEVVLPRLDRNFGGYQDIDAGGYQLMINYRPLQSPEQIAERVTLGDVLAGRVSAESVRDRIVLIGTTANSIQDTWSTTYPGPSAADRQAAGVFMQAHMVSHLLSAVLDNRPLIQTWPAGVDLLWIAAWAGVGGAIAYGVTTPSVQARRLRLLLGLLAAESMLLGLSWALLIHSGYWVPLVPAALALGSTAGIAILISPTPVRKVKSL